MPCCLRFLRPAALLLALLSPLQADDWSLQDNPELAAFFEAEVTRVEQATALHSFRTLAEWEQARPRLREQLLDMLGLHPLPARSPLEPQITGTIQAAEFRVERLTFQSLPGLYVTASLYVPHQVSEPLPAVLYVCGHGSVRKDGISYGNKAQYQHHGAWFARNGYVCLIIDTLQLGEIEGIHHGTYRYDRWWWNSRGYTPAGVEAWNCMRALDYLQSRPEVDGSRLGVSGRSGGGAYSWWIAAVDDRIQCAVPVAGITSLRNHVVDGCVEGHCDCMYMVNSCRWNFATVAALVAPRPLLISNTDKDTIFPLEGVLEIHREVRHIYQLYQKPENLGLQITEGPHKDTQELHIHAFRWMNRFLRQDLSLITTVATPFFQPEQLRVFTALPDHQINTTVDEVFVPPAAVPDAADRDALLQNPQHWQSATLDRLREKCFSAWPDASGSFSADTPVKLSAARPLPAAAAPTAGMVVTRLQFDSQPHVPVFVDVIHHSQSALPDVTHVHLLVADEETWSACGPLLSDSTGADRQSTTVSARLQLLLQQVAGDPGAAVAVFAPRGTGPFRWHGDARKQTQIQRRFQLLGMTVDGMRVWDIRRALQVLRGHCGSPAPISLYASGQGDLLCICASLFEPPVQHLCLTGRPPAIPAGQQPSLLNQARVVHEQELLALAAWRAPIQLQQTSPIMDLARQLTADQRWQGCAVEVTE